jgi:rhamnosyltransferase subunit B
MRILISTLGSHGDMHPFLGIGRELRRRGHQVTIIAPAMYAELAGSTNFEFVPAGTVEQFDRLSGDPDIWHPRRALAVIAKGTAEMIEPYYRAIVDRYVPGETVSVISSLVFGGRIAQEKFSVPTVSVHLSPLVLRSICQPSYVPPLPLFAWEPAWVKRFLFAAADWLVIDRLLGPPINEFRGSLGLKPVKGIFKDWIHSPDRVIGLFPEWFSPSPGDWPAQTVVTGFPLFDESNVLSLDEKLIRFLDSGDRPIAFTPGSAMRHGRRFFEVAVETCQRLGQRGVLLSRHLDHLPPRLPPEVFHADYAPFSQLLPRCAALVHHGGIGTSAQGLAAGVPQLVMPMAHDQPDNAKHLIRLGVAQAVGVNRFSVGRASRALKYLLGSAEVAAACASIRGKFQGDDSSVQTAICIERCLQATNKGMS